jgi:hypothetical protein
MKHFNFGKEKQPWITPLSRMQLNGSCRMLRRTFREILAFVYCAEDREIGHGTQRFRSMIIQAMFDACIDWIAYALAHLQILQSMMTVLEYATG